MNRAMTTNRPEEMAMADNPRLSWIILLAIGGFGLVGCTSIQDRSLVYGERSGVNIAYALILPRPCLSKSTRVYSAA